MLDKVIKSLDNIIIIYESLIAHFEEKVKSAIAIAPLNNGFKRNIRQKKK